AVLAVDDRLGPLAVGLVELGRLVRVDFLLADLAVYLGHQHAGAGDQHQAEAAVGFGRAHRAVGLVVVVAGLVPVGVVRQGHEAQPGPDALAGHLVGDPAGDDDAAGQFEVGLEWRQPLGVVESHAGAHVRPGLGRVGVDQVLRLLGDVLELVAAVLIGERLEAGVVAAVGGDVDAGERLAGAALADDALDDPAGGDDVDELGAGQH